MSYSNTIEIDIDNVDELRTNYEDENDKLPVLT